MIYSCVASSSFAFIIWLQETIARHLVIHGHITITPKKNYQLRYAKGESIKLLKKIYRRPNCTCLTRKRLKIEKMLSIVGEQL